MPYVLLRNNDDYHFSKAVDRLVRGDWRPGLEYGLKCSQLTDSHFGPPVLELAEVHIAMWKCMWLKAGNMKLVKM